MNETTVDTTNKYNDNSFLNSVGIVMVDAAEMAETQNQTEPRKSNTNKHLENVAQISISTVTDNVKPPPEMLDVCDIPSISTTPKINVQDSEDRGGEKNQSIKMCHSVNDMRSDPTLASDIPRYIIFLIDDHFFLEF